MCLPYLPRCCHEFVDLDGMRFGCCLDIVISVQPNQVQKNLSKSCQEAPGRGGTFWAMGGPSGPWEVPELAPLPGLRGASSSSGARRRQFWCLLSLFGSRCFIVFSYDVFSTSRCLFHDLFVVV